MNNLLKVLSVAALLITVGCAPKSDTSQNMQMDGDIITAADQEALTAEQILQGLKDGNERYMNNNLTNYDYKEQISKTVSGQFPEAVILSCIDSRVPVENVFDKGVGDIFVARVAGNTVNPDILGSIEYGTAVAGSKLVVVMGHEACGAVKAAIDEAELSSNADVLLARINPAIESLRNYEGQQAASNASYVDEVVKTNVDLTIEEMLEESPVLKNLLDEGEIMVVGAYYDLDSGKVTFVD